jgi:hypothetical protein
LYRLCQSRGLGITVMKTLPFFRSCDTEHGESRRVV